jgi:hypothetical protein
MIKQFIKWLDSSMFPSTTAEEYDEEMLAQAKLELSKAQDGLLYAQAMVTYRGAQVERLSNKTNASNTTSVSE